MSRHTYPMGIIGNCAYMAYVDLDANINFMCWPRFDGDFIFGRLLDAPNGGYYYIRPAGENYESRQYYLTNTNILCTEFTCPDGRFRVIDLAPRFYQFERYFKPLMLVRKVEPLEGHPQIRIACQPMGEHGKVKPQSYIGSNHIRFLGLERPIRLTSDFPLSFMLEGHPAVLEKPCYNILTYGIPLEGPLATTAEDFLSKTRQYWQAWINSATIPHFYQKEVIRSALTLKLHQFEDTGAIIASGTTSLPESPGSGRNWDYRFCWLRDSYYTLRALRNLGHFEELTDYSNFIQNIAGAEAERYHPVYSITGRSDVIEERQLELPGYQGNQPVRIGNQAHEHIQNDVYGQALVSLLPLYTDERFTGKDQKLALANTRHLLARIEATMEEKDAGLWEFRNRQRQHCYTFLFHWAGSHAAAKIGAYFGEKKLAAKAAKLVKRAAQQIEACYDPKDRVYGQAIGAPYLDASLFQLITLKYLDPASEKAHHHLRKLERELSHGKSLIYRYKHPDDFGLPETTFLVCAFWHVEALAAIGQTPEAIARLEDLLTSGNHLGLFSEDVDAQTGSQWGNFPQTYSHVGLMNAVFTIAQKLGRPDFLVY